jgi:hypothetical protein
MEMLSLHFNKQVFINALKANKNMVTYLSTTIALMVIMIMHGLIQGNLKAEYFAYAIVVSFALLFSGIFLFVGMLTGVWKYAQIRHSPQFHAHYYVDIAHRSSLLYAPASLIIAVMAAISVLPEPVNMLFVGINLFFFSFSILSYIVP